MIQQPNFSLGSVFDAQQQQALQQQVLTDEQLKRYLEVTNPAAGLGLAQNVAQAQGNIPQLQTQVQASGLGEGVMKGISNAIGNAQQIHAYKQQVAAQQGIANQYALAQQQRQQFLNNQIGLQQQAQAAAAKELGGRAGALYPYLDHAGQQSALSDTVKSENDLKYAPQKQAALNQVELGHIPQKAVATEQGARQVRALQDAEYGTKPMEVGGIPQPSRVNQYERVYGRKPVTSLDIGKQYLGNQQADVNYQKAHAELGALPDKLGREAQKDQLTIKAKQVEAQYADALAKLELETRQGNLQDAQMKRQGLERGRSQYEQAMQRYDSMTPEQVKMYNSLNKSNGLPFELPEKKVTEMKAAIKDGKVREFYDPVTGKVTKAQR